jgi:hypothetical protein
MVAEATVVADMPKTRLESELVPVMTSASLSSKILTIAKDIAELAIEISQ